MTEFEFATELILAHRQAVPAARSLLVGVSGIDGSGKGFVTARIAAGLESQGVRCAVINVDGWLELPSRRFDPNDPAEHFYAHGIRFEEMFTHLILPLRASRSVKHSAPLADATNLEAFHTHVYDFENIDIILLEGIFLFRRTLRPHFDVTLWVDCSFETALARALARGQEGLPPEETLRDFETIYFPAQQLHLARDTPRAFATAVVHNDPRLPQEPR